jgi:hypothetical protein
VTITWTIPSSTGTTGKLTRPTVSGLKLSPTRFHRGTLRARLGTRTSKGTIVSFRLSTHATVRLTFERALQGRRVGGRCVRANTSNRRARACRRYSAVPGAATLAAPGGSDHVVFQGVLDGGRRLRPGSYRLSLTASNAAGAAPGIARASFTLVR